MKRILAGLLALIVLVANLAGLAQAAPQASGELDTTFAGFGNGGKVIPISVPGSDYLRAYMALQPDGKIVEAWGDGQNTRLLRYLPDGTLDNSFSGDGFATIETPFTSHVNDVALQADGQIIVAGSILSASNDFFLARLTSYGALETSFGSGGFVVTDFDGGDDLAEAVLVQPDGKIVAAGRASFGGDDDFGAARYNADGTLDVTFGGTGMVTVGFGDVEDVEDIVLLEDGDLLLAGPAWPDFIFGDADFALARLNADGTLDTGFDGDGKLTTGFGGDEEVRAVAIQSDGKILAAGDDSSNVLVARYLPDGALDSTFDGDGKLSIGSLSGLINGIAIQPDGKIVLLGLHRSPDGDYKFAFYRLIPDGSLDPTFDGDGYTFIDFRNIDFGVDVALLADGRILAGGVSDRIPVLMRLWPDGSLDAGGQQALDFADPFLGPEALELASDLAIQQDGKIVVAGDIGNASDSDRNFALARFWPDGMLDTSFGMLGSLSFGFGAKEVAKAVAVQPDGKILAAGTTGLDVAANIMLARFLSNGTPDTSFGFLGYRVADFDGADDYGLALALAPDGKTVVAGYNHKGLQKGTPMIAVRFNSDGTLDNTFDLDGKFQRAVIIGVLNTAYAVVVQPDLKVVLAGTAGGDFALLRLNADGSPDESFGASGAVVTDMGNTDTIYGLALQEDGSLVVAGSSTSALSSDFALARYTAGGVLDTTFGAEGKVYVDFGGVDAAYALDLRADGVTIVAGCADDHFAVAQILPDGLLDPAFNGTGTATTDFMGSAECAYAVKFTEGDRILTAGVQHAFANANMALARFMTTPSQPPPPSPGGSSLFLPLVVR
jgi:uncharacterized delta-60 repeat protein